MNLNIAPYLHTMSTKTQPYTLYQTLCCNIPKKKLTNKDKQKFMSNIDKLSEAQNMEFLRLVVEHGRIKFLQSQKIAEDVKDDKNLEGKEKANTEETKNFSMKKIPYCKSRSDTCHEFDLKNLKDDVLLWILFRFCSICAQEIS
jgi:hypothetical protein